MNKLGDFLYGLWIDESGGAAGRLGLGIVGAAIGGFFGGPMGAQAGFLIGSLAGNIIFPHELPDIEGQRLDPNKLMLSAYGAPIPIGFGRFVVGGTVAYYPGFVEHEITQEVGGKGAPTQTIVSYTYTGSFRVNLCEGPVDAILKIWANRKLIYDATTGTEPIIDLAGLNEAPGPQAIRLYLGTEDQFPDPTEQADKGVGATPAYRGIAGIFFQNYSLDTTGGVPPQITALVATSTTPVDIIVTLPSGGEGVRYEWQPGKQTFLSDGVARISNENQQILATASNTPGDLLFPCVDGEGNFYGIEEGLFNDPVISKYSGKTLNLLVTGSPAKDPADGSGITGGGYFWKRGRVFGGVKDPLTGELHGEKLYAQRTQLSQPAAVMVISLDDLTNEFGGVIVNYTAKLGMESLAIDSERFLWTASEGSDTEINRIDPGSGRPVETYTLTGETFDRMGYDPVTNSLILCKQGASGTAKLARWGLDSKTIDAELTGITINSDANRNLSAFWNGPTTDGKFYLHVTAAFDTFREFNIHDMTAGETFDPVARWGLTFDRTRLAIFDESRQAMIADQFGGADLHWLYINRETANLIQVKDIVEDICLRVGLVASQFNVSNLTQQLHGYLVSQRVQANRVIDPLRRFFFFNPILEDFKIKFPLLGTSSVATIPEEDLAAGDDGEIRVETDKVAEQIINEIELPEVLEMESAGENREYQPQVQRAKRPRSTTNSKRKKFLSFPGTFLSDADAAQRLESLLYQIWTKRSPVTIRTSQKWSRLSPADTITVNSDGITRQVILGQIDLGANNILEMKGASDDPNTLISFKPGFSGTIPDQIILQTSPSELLLMDISLLRDQDDGFGIYIGGAPFNDQGWRGEEIYRSVDGVDYSPFSFIPGSRAADHGFATSTLPDADVGVWDRTSTLNVSMFRGTLASSTEELVLDGANLILYGNELLCFVTSVDNGNGNFTISTLLRGRFATEGETGLHVAEERVVVIDENTLIRKPMNLSIQNIPYFYKGVTRGGSFIDALRKTLTVQGKSQWTWAPVHIKGSITSGSWDISWTWRNRINGRWRDILGLNPTGSFDYEVDVLSGPGGSVLNTYTIIATANGSVVNAGSHSFHYDDDDQTIDFGSPQTTVTFKVYPLSLGGVGRGYPTEVTLVGG